MTVEQFAYLKSPEKIRVAIINEGGPRLSVEEIERRLSCMPRRLERVFVEEPVASDGADFRVAKLKPETKPKPFKDLYMRVRYLPTAVENLVRKMQALQAEAEEVGADDYVTCLRAANEAFEREVQIARLEIQIRREMGK